jgi:hypothetical protein
VAYATGFWCTRSWRGVWAPLDESFSMETTEESVEPMAVEMRSAVPALAAGGAALRDRLGQALCTPTFYGAVYGLAYNTSYLIVVGEPAPLGQRPPHLSIAPGFVRATGDAPFDIDYQAPIPAYLAESRDASAAIESANAGRFRAVIEQDAGARSLAHLWKDGFELAPQNWGSDFIVKMTQAYYDPFVRWSVLYNFGLEAIARNSIVALANGDELLAAQAVAGNVIFDGSWGSIQLGVVDGTKPLPSVVNA